MPDAEPLADETPPADEDDAREAHDTAARAHTESEATVAHAERTTGAPHADAEPGAPAEGSLVNGAVLDSVRATLELVGARGDAIARRGFDDVLAQAAGLSLLNAMNAQQNAYVSANATVLTTVARILALRPDGRGVTPDD